MGSSLWNVLNNLAEGILKIKFKYGHNNKICETCVIKYKNCECFLEYTNFRDNLKKKQMFMLQ